MINATLLIVHEIDSAYWKEWDLFRLPGGITGFLIIHLPLVFIILWGLVQLAAHRQAGIVLSLILALSGVIAFGLHMYFIRKGRPEFKTWVSLSVLISTFLVSLVQAGVSLYQLLVI